MLSWAPQQGGLDCNHQMIPLGLPARWGAPLTHTFSSHSDPLKKPGRGAIRVTVPTKRVGKASAVNTITRWSLNQTEGLSDNRRDAGRRIGPVGFGWCGTFNVWGAISERGKHASETAFVERCPKVPTEQSLNSSEPIHTIRSSGHLKEGAIASAQGRSKTLLARRVVAPTS